MRRLPRTPALAISLCLAGCSASPAPDETHDDSADGETIRETDVPAASSLAKDRGIPLEEAVERMRWQRALDPFEDALLLAMEGNYGGIWIDTENGDRVQVNVVTGDTSVPWQERERSGDAADGDEVMEIARGLQLGDAVDVRPVTFTRTELDFVAALLDAELESPNQESAFPLQKALRIDQNAVEIRQPPPEFLTAAQETFMASVFDRYGAILVESEYDGVPRERSCEGAACEPPLRAGIAVVNQDTGESCTGAFFARSRADGLPYVLTAGHCGAGTASSFVDGGGREIGPMHRAVHDESDDAAIIRIRDESASEPRPWVLVTESEQTVENTEYPIARTGRSHIGMRVCVTGATTGSACGTVTRLSLTSRNYGEADVCIRPGDSGAPVFASHTAFGIVSGDLPPDGDCHLLYTGISRGEQLLRVAVATDDSAGGGQDMGPPAGAKRQLQYIVIAHPDDEGSSWSLIERSSANYPVFILLTRGEETSYCDDPGHEPTLENGADSGEIAPSPYPQSKLSSECAAARMSSWHGFLNAQTDLDPYLDHDSDMTAHGRLNAEVLEGDPTPERWDNGVAQSTPYFDLWVGPQSARMIFDLGDGDLSEEEVVWAVMTARRIRHTYFPITNEYGAIGASFYNESHPDCGTYTHSDHGMVHQALWNNDLGLWAQWARTCRTDPAADRTGTMEREIFDATFTVEADGTRTGSFQRHYGWLRTDTWPYGEHDNVSGGHFSRIQTFWKRSWR